MLPELKSKLGECLAEFQEINLKIPESNQMSIRKKNTLVDHLLKVDREIRKIVALPENVVPFLVPGRLIRIAILNTDTKQEQDWGWGILVNFTKQKINPKNMKSLGKNIELKQIMESNESHYILDVYLYVSDRLTKDNMVQPGNTSTKDGRLGIVPVVLHPSTLHSVSSV